MPRPVTTTTGDALAVVRDAVREARELSSRVIGQEHVLLALGNRPSSLGARMLASLGVDPAALRQLHTWMSIRPAGGGAGGGGGGGSTPGPAPTPRVMKALEEAEAEASDQDRPTTTADLVIGILRARVGVGYDLLRGASVGLERAREALAALDPVDGDGDNGRELSSVEPVSVVAAFAEAAG